MEKYLDSLEAMEFLGIKSRGTLHIYVKKHGLQKYKKGTKPVYKRSDLENFLEPKPVNGKKSRR